MKSVKISIIIPVFHTENYLERCFDSILKQNVQGKVEIIAIDDGSTDSSGQICDVYRSCYPETFRVIHKENEGQSAARNVGIKIASGDYIYCVDSDDYLEMGVLKNIIDALASGADIYETGFRVRRGNICERIQMPIASEKAMCPFEYLKRAMREYTYEWYPWKYIIKREFFDNMQNQFPVGMRYEDVFLMPRLLMSADAIQPLNLLVYNYFVGRPGATTSGIHVKTEYDKLKAAEENIQKFAGMEDEELKDLLCDSFSKLYFSSLIILYGILDKNERDAFYETLKEKQYLTNYARSGRQLKIKRLISIIGLRNTSKLLYIRMVIKKYGKNV